MVLEEMEEKLIRYRTAYVLSKKSLLLISIIVVIIIAFIFSNSTKQIVLISGKEEIASFWINGKKYEDAEDVDKIVKILKKYETGSSKEYFPRSMDGTVIEMSYIDNHKPRHVILGDVNFVYESADQKLFDIINGDEMLLEIESFLKSSSEDYELIEITEDVIERNDRKLVFQDKPENIEELVVSNFYLSKITGDFSIWEFIYPGMAEVIRNNSIEAYCKGLGTKYMKITDIKLMSEEDIVKQTDYGDKLVDAAIFHNGRTFTDYIDKHEIDKYKIVKIEYYFEYTDKSMEGSPQYPPGYSMRYYLLEVDSKGNYVISTRTIPRGIDAHVSEVYVNEKLGFELIVPDNWSGKYRVEEVGNKVTFFYTGYAYESGGLQEFFTIIAVDEKEYSEGAWTSEFILGTKNGVTFICISPIDCGISDEEIAEEFMKLDVDKLKTKELFKIK